MIMKLIRRTFITNFAILGLGLLTSVLLSRWLGPAGRGEVAAALLWPMLLVYIGSIGLIPATLYFTTRQDFRVEDVFGNVIVLAMIQSFIIMGFGYIALPWLLKSQTTELISTARIYLIVIPISMITQCGISVIQGKMKISALNQLRMIIPVGYLIGISGLLTINWLHVFDIVILNIVLNIVTMIITLCVLKKLNVRIFARLNKDMMKDVLKYGIQVQAGDISQLANLRLDQALIAAWLPASQLGLYVVAVSCANITQSLAEAVKLVVIPSIAQEKSTPEKISLLKEIFRKYWLISILTTSLMGIFLPWTLSIVFGTDFQGAIWPAEVLLLAAVLVGSKDVLSGGARILGNPWIVSVAEIVALIATVVFLIILLPTAGILGAAATSLIAYLLALLLLMYKFNKLYETAMADFFYFSFKDVTSLLSNFYRIRKNILRFNKS